METVELTKVAATPEPPSEYSEKTKALWRSLVSRVAGNDGSLSLFKVGFDALHRCERCREELEREGFVIHSARSNVRRRNPLLNDLALAEKTVGVVFSVLRLYESESDFQYRRYCDEREKLVSGFSATSK